MLRSDAREVVRALVQGVVGEAKETTYDDETLKHMTGHQINKHLDKLKAKDNFANRFIAKGWGHKRRQDIHREHPEDPDVKASKAHEDKVNALRGEVQRRHGPSFYEIPPHGLRTKRSDWKF
jgi:hypothetical protein